MGAVATEEELVRSAFHIARSEAWRALPRLGRDPVVDLDDLESECRLQLVKLARRYDPSQGASFATFARRRLRGHMTDVVRQRARRSTDGAGGFFQETSFDNVLKSGRNDPDPVQWEPTDPSPSAHDRLETEAELDLVRELPARESEALLRLAMGDTAAAVAEDWGCTEAWVYRKVMDGRGRLETWRVEEAAGSPPG